MVNSIIDQFITDFEPLATTAYESERLNKIKSEFTTIKDITKKALDYAQAGNMTEAEDYYFNNGFSKQDDFQTQR